MLMQDGTGRRAAGRGQGRERGGGFGGGRGLGPCGSGQMRLRRQGNGRSEVETGDARLGAGYRGRHLTSTPLSEEIARLRETLERLERSAVLESSR